MGPSDYTRRVSFNERIYLAAERRAPGFCIQLVLEFDAEMPPGLEDRLTAAVAQAVAQNPGARLILRGVLGWTRWVAAGPVPPVRLVPPWPPGAPAPPEVERPLSPTLGPTCELVLTGGSAPRLVFRCFHGVMDASGLLHFATEVFRALRSESMQGAPCRLNDTEFVTALAGRRRRPMLKDAWPALLPRVAAAPPIAGRAVNWRRARISRSVPALVAKLSAALARHAGQNALIMVPVDLRHYGREPPSTANRTCPLFLDISPEQGWRAVHKVLLRRLMEREPLRLDPAEGVAPWLPLVWLTALYGLWVAGHRRKGRFPFSALVTHLALPSLDVLSGDGLRPSAVFLLPPQSDFIPLCVSAVTSPTCTDLIISGPEDLLGPAQLAALSEALRDAVAPPT